MNVNLRCCIFCCDELYASGEKDKSEVIKKLWLTDSEDVALTPDESLALRVDTLQSKAQYKKQYDFFKEKGGFHFATPYQ